MVGIVSGVRDVSMTGEFFFFLFFRNESLINEGGG